MIIKYMEDDSTYREVEKIKSRKQKVRV